MGKIQVDLSETEDKIVKIYMGLNNINSKKRAINSIILDHIKILEVLEENGDSPSD